MGRSKPRDARLDALLAELPIERLAAELARRRVVDPIEGLLSAMEPSVEQAKEAFGQSTLEEMVEALPPEDGAAKACPRCGKLVRVRGRRRARTVQTLSGPLRLLRHYHYCEACQHGFYPRDIELGLPEGGTLSREVEKRVLDFALNCPFAEAEERWNLHYSTRISSNLARQVIERVGRRCEATDDAALAHTTQPRTRKAPQLVVVQTDGGHVPIRGTEPWKEAKLGVIVDGDCYASGRRRQRGLISQARYVGVLGEQKEFRERLDISLRMEQAGGATKAVWVGDGAPGNWTLARSLLPQAVQVLDWHHAIEHAVDCAKEIFGEQDPFVAVWQQSVEKRLRRDGVVQIIEELGDCADFVKRGQRKAIWNLLRYYRTNRSRLRYNEFREQGLPIGSGIVESAHRHVVQRRMKNAGQRWSLHRARRMVRMRCASATAGTRRFYWALLAAERLTRTGQIPKVGWTKTRASNHG